MSAGMADIIATHAVAGVSGGTHTACRCDGTWVPHVVYRAHLAAELTKAGYGNVQEAKAEALTDAANWLANGEAAGIIAYDGPSNRGEVTDAYDAALEDPEGWLRERAAAALAIEPAGLYREERDGMAEAWREGRASGPDALNPYEGPDSLAVAMNDEVGRALVQAIHDRKAASHGN